MVSKFFKSKNSFDSLVDPLQNSLGQYWYLNSKESFPYCWNTDVFSDEEIEKIIIIGIRYGIQRSYTGVDKDESCLDHRRSFTSWIMPNDHTKWIYERLSLLVNENNNSYFKFDLSMIETLQFTYYDSSEMGCYKSHIDPINWNLPHNRKLSIVVQLSDPNDYEGGELKLHNSHCPIEIKKEKGLTVTFPSYTLHEVTPVTKGNRYSLVAWVHGPAFK